MTLSIIIAKTGGPEVLEKREQSLPALGPKEVRLRHTAIGLNFIDTYLRSGLYPVELPSSLGFEASGVVEEIGAEVSGVAVGDRVTYCKGPAGAYTETRNIDESLLVKIPSGLSDDIASATFLKGLTAHMLLKGVRNTQAGDTLLVHAAAGGVGVLLTQWAKLLGAHVIGVVGSTEKADRAKPNGCDHVIIRSETKDIAAAVRELTEGEGVNAVYDSVGAATFMSSLDSLKVRGMMVTYGNASGPPPPIAPLELSKRGSLFLTRPTMFHYFDKRDEYESAANELFGFLSDGRIKAEIGQTYALSDVAQAHADLEARKTTSATVLHP